MNDVRVRLASLGMNPIGTGSIDELQRFLESDVDRWSKVVEAAGIAHTE
jgi:tripartite-type tricarboxylate transporter receptor subunit TctC